MSDPEPTSSTTKQALAGEALAATGARPPDALATKGARLKVEVHRLDGGLERGESDARSLSADGFPIYTPPDLDRARWIPVRDIKYVVFGSVDDPDLEADPGEKSQARKAILRFRDGEWIAAYMDPGQPPDGAGLAIKIRLTERQRVIPAIAANPALLEMLFVDLWATSTDSAQPHRRRSDIVEAAARQLRYHAFAAVDADFVALAHHLDDQVETFLLQLLRGAGPKGLAGMPVVRQQESTKDGNATPPLILRPLLEHRRSRIEAYARARKLEWVEDESNADSRYDRNYLRNELLVQLDTRFPGYRETLARTARNLADHALLAEELARIDAQSLEKAR